MYKSVTNEKIRVVEKNHTENVVRFQMTRQMTASVSILAVPGESRRIMIA